MSPHDHGPEDPDDYTAHVQLANQFVNAANSKLEAGYQPYIVAAGLRHAASNFSAFAAELADAPPEAYEEMLKQFEEGLSYYRGVHSAKKQGPQTGLEQLVAQAKNDSGLSD